MTDRVKLTYLLFVILLTACVPGGVAFTPERAATQDLIDNHHAIPESIRIHQIQSWQERQIVLASYTSNEDNQEWHCEGVFETMRGPTGWRVRGAGSGCTNPPDMAPLVSGSGVQGAAPDQYSYAHGLVNLPDAKWVEITWKDGTVQRADIVNRSYLALRNGEHHNIPKVQVLDTAEEVIHETENKIAPGKLP